MEGSQSHALAMHLLNYGAFRALRFTPLVIQLLCISKQSLPRYSHFARIQVKQNARVLPRLIVIGSSTASNMRP